MAKSFYTSKVAAQRAKQKQMNDSTSKIAVNNVIKNVSSARAGQIAFFDVNGINNTIDSLFESKHINIFSGKKTKANAMFKDDSIVGSKFISNMNKPGNNLFEEMLKIAQKSQTVSFQKGTGLMNRAIYLDKEINHNYTTQKGMQDFQEFKKAVNKFEDIKNNGGFVIDYDIESLGGVNGIGHQQLDHITEIASFVEKFEAGGAHKRVETVHSLFGFSDDEYNDIKKYIEGLRGKTAKELSGKDNVYLSRLSMMSDKNIKLGYEGIDVRIIDTAGTLSEKELTRNVDNALKGLEVYRNIGKYQEEQMIAAGMKGSLVDYKKGYVKKVQDLISYGKGFNGATYDPNRTIVTGHNIEQFDGPAMRSYTGYDPTNPTISVLDTHVRTRWQEELMGQGSHLKNIDKTKISNATKLHGTGTQDFFRAITGLGDGQAHNALIDSENHFNLLMDNTLFGNTLINDTAVMERKLNNLKSGYVQDGRPGVFYMGSTDQLGYSNRNNALSFVYNPLDKNFKTYEGFNVAGGKVTKEDLKAYGPKANALYTHKVYEIELNKDNWRKQFEGLGLSQDSLDEFYQQYKNLDKMYMIASKEYMDKEALKKYGVNNAFEYEDGKTYFQLLTDKNQVASAMGAKIGYENTDGSIDFMNNVVDALDFQIMEEASDGSINVRKVRGQEAAKEIVDRSTYRTSLDSAARTVREGSYSKLSQQRLFNMNNHQNISAVIADRVANNKDLTMDITSSLIDELGWSDFNGNRKIIPERLTKATVLDKYMENMDPFFKVMDEEIAKAFGVGNIQELFDTFDSAAGFKVSNKITGQSDMYAKMDFMFRQTLNNVLESQDAKGVMAGRPVLMTGREMNRLDFNRYDVFPEQANKRIKAGMLNASEDILSLDLNGNDSLIKMFSNGKFDGMDVIPHSNAAYDSLLEAYDFFNKQDGFKAEGDYKGVFKGLSKKDIETNYRNGNLSILQDKMMHKIKERTTELRGKDAGFGYKFARTMQDPTKAIEQLSKLSEDQLRDLISKNLVNPENFMSARTASGSEDVINSLVDNYFMTFKESDLEKQMSGFNKKQKDIIRNQYKLARNESYERAKELLSATKNTDLDVMMIGKGSDSRMFLGKGSDIRELNFHKYTLQDGIIEYALGNNNYAANFAYNTSGLVKNGWANGVTERGLDKIKVTNNVQNAIDQTRSLDKVVQYAQKGGRNVLDDLVYNINSKRGGLLREISPRREALNYSNTFQRAMQIDFNGLVSILPELKDAGVIDAIASQVGVTDDYKAQFNKVVEDIRGRAYRPKGISDLYAYESNLYFQLFDANITEMINEHIDFGGNEELRTLFQGATNYTKDTVYLKGQKTLYNKSAAYGAAKFDKARPPIYQYGNAEMYRRDELTAAVNQGRTEADIFNSVFVDGKVTSTAAEKLMHGDNYTAGVTLKYLNTSSNDLRNAIATNKDKDNSLAKVVNGLKDEAAEKAAKQKLLDKAKGLSTYEQQSLINSRVFDTAFHKTNKQTIAKKKELLINHEKTIEYIEGLKSSLNDLFPTITPTGEVIYSKGIEVKMGDRLGVFGESEETIRANWDGIYRSRYYNNGRLMNQTDLNNAIKTAGLSNSGDEAIIKFLDKTYDRRNEVIRKYQTYGAKIFNATSEKSTAESLAMNIGSLDERLTTFLKENGREDLVGNVLTKEYEDIILNELGNKKIGKQTFKELYMKEKHAFSDFLTGLDGFGDISQFMALDSVKHKAASLAIENGLNNLSLDGMMNKDTLTALFGRSDVLGADGKINFENIEEVNLRALEKLDKKAYESFTKVDKLDGVGHKGYSHVVQVRDDSAGTFAGRYTKVDGSLIDGVEDYKGAKFSKHMNTNLRRAVYDDDSLTLAKTRLSGLGLSDEFAGTFGHVLDDSGNIKVDMKGKSILDPIVQRMEGLLKVGPGETLLSAETDERFNYLKNVFGENAGKISSKRAELVYSEFQGRRAINFNKNTAFNQKAYDNLVNNKVEEYRFKELDLTTARPGVADDWMSLDVGGQGNTVTSAVNNPYTNNLMIKYGDGANDLLAINRMPELHFEDSLIKTQYISKLKGFQDLIQQVNKGEGTNEEIVRWQGQIQSTAQDIKDLQKKAITSKTGIDGQLLEVRADQSFFGKASGIVFNDTTSLEDIMYMTAEEKAKRVKQITEDNPLFNKAFFKGKSLAEHYAEGKALDNVFLSRDAFANMGYFDDDFMNQIFEGNSKYKDLLTADRATKVSKMEELLQSQGDSFISVRYPEIMEGSDKVLMGYLNPELRGNQMQVVGHTGMSMKMDHDGDQGAVIRAKTSNDMSMINYLTQENVTDKSLIAHAQATESIMMKRAVNENWYWDNQVKGKLIKEAEVAHLTKMQNGKTMLDVIAGDKVIDGRMISSMIDPDNTTIKQYEKLLERYKPHLKTTAGFMSDKEFKGDVHAAAVKAVEAAEGYSVEEYANAYAYQLYKDENVSKSSKKAIGEINVTNQKINTAMVNLMDTADADYNYMSSISKDLFHIAEEQAISAKSSIEGLDPDRAKKWNEDVVRLVTGGGNADEVLQMKNNLVEWGQKYMSKDINLEQYWNSSSYFQDKVNTTFKTSLDNIDDFRIFLKNNDTEVKNMVINDFVNKIGDMRDVDNVGKLLDQMSYGQSTSGVSKGIMEHISIENKSMNSDQFMEMREMMISAENDVRNIEINQKINSERIMSNVSGEIIDSMERNASKKSMGHAILEGAGDLFKDIGSSKLALGAVGIAAGIMVAGYAAGRPRPADVHAMEEAQDYAPMDGYTPLSDPGMAFSRGGNAGYVVNINARTDKGRDHAVNAIQQALASGTSSNINVSMNINDNYGNMKDRDLQRAIEDVFR